MRNKKELETNIETSAVSVAPERKKKPRLSLAARIYTVFTAIVVFIAAFVSVYVYSWFLERESVGAYAPISAPDSLFIAAGHSDMENYVFENIRYLYFHGIDASAPGEYYDYLFCVYGKGINQYRIQLAYTTNNQFTYEIFYADEHEVEPSEGYYISYDMHTVADTTYYYTIRKDADSGEDVAVEGHFLNLKDPADSDGNMLAKDAGDNDAYFDLTYENGENSVYANVNKYGAPLYWQTSQPIRAHENASDLSKPFSHYFVLRIHTQGRVNDRETDVICISATSKSSG